MCGDDEVFQKTGFNTIHGVFGGCQNNLLFASLFAFANKLLFTFANKLCRCLTFVRVHSGLLFAQYLSQFNLPGVRVSWS